MVAPRWLKTCWQGIRACGAGVMRLLRWLLWLVLLLLAAGQVFVLTSRDLRVPDFVLRQIGSSLDEAGLKAEFGRVSLDPTGRLLLQDATLSLTALGTPIMQAQAIYVRLNPVALWRGELDPVTIRFSGVDLLIPPTLSPSGRAAPIISGIDAMVEKTDRPGILALRHGHARLGPLPLVAHGEISLRAGTSTAPPEPWSELLTKFSRNYLDFSRLAARVLPRLPQLIRPRLELELRPRAGPNFTTDLRFTLTIGELVTLTQNPDETPHARLSDIQVSSQFGLAVDPDLAPLALRVGRVEGPAGIVLEEVVGRLQSDLSFAPLQVSPGPLQLSIAGVHHPAGSLQSFTAASWLGGWPNLPWDATARFADEPWSLEADLDVTTAAGRVALAGEVGRETLDLAARLLPIDVPALLWWDTAPHLRGEFNLATGGRPLRARVHFSTGPVVARGVPLDATAARVRWEGHRIIADQIQLRRGRSEASGSYEMDTQELDFRFLLRGQLDPSDIDGWFRDWWPRLFAQFDFKTAPPTASVEVSGRWGQPLATRVFASADAIHPVVRQIAMDRLQARLFVRPGWADVLHFRAERPIGTVEGQFARQWKLPDSRRWTRIEVHAGGITDLAPVPRLLTQTGEALIAPFSFPTPLEVRLDGTTVRADAGAPTTQDYTISGKATGPWSFHAFPLENIEFEAHQRDGTVLVESFRAGLAAGELEGRVELRGAGDTKTMAFDIDLIDASLGRTLHDVSAWTAQRRGDPRAAETDLEKQLATGALTLSLSAEGPATDPFSLQGRGSAAIADANLANINLLGVLSAMLQRTLLNFSTLQLSHANADFELDGPRVVFPEVKITGNRGAVDAVGTYSLIDRTLDFTTRVRPFEGGEGLLDAMFTPFSSALEVKLTGRLDDPQWTFVYGPTNLLRNLTGENARNRNIDLAPDAPAPSPSSAPPEESTESSAKGGGAEAPSAPPR